jgi:hypothetical protein
MDTVDLNLTKRRSRGPKLLRSLILGGENPTAFKEMCPNVALLEGMCAPAVPQPVQRQGT